MSVRSAVITGADQPLGRAVAEGIAGSVDSLTLGGVDEEALQATVEAVSTMVDEVVHLRTDVRDEFDVERLMETASRAGGGSIDLVVPCARVSHLNGSTPVTEWSYAGFDDELRTNLRGVFTSVREALPHCTASSRIVVPREDATNDDGILPVGEAAIEVLAITVDGSGPSCEVVTVDRIPLDTDTEVSATQVLDALAE